MAKNVPETDAKQSERFRKALAELEAAGELSPTGGEAFDAVMDVMRRRAALRVEGLENPPSTGNRSED